MNARTLTILRAFDLCSSAFICGLCLTFAPAAAAGDKPAVFRIVTRELPSRFMPHGPLTDADRMAHDLLFEPLVVAVRDGDSVRYRPGLAETIPTGQGTNLTFRLRPDAKWSSGDAIGADDVRRAIQKFRDDPGSAFAYAALLGEPQHGRSPREVAVSLRHGLVNPNECFTFPISHPKSDDDPTPLGSGPFKYAGPIAQGIRFVKNAHHPAAAKTAFDEIHWFAAKDEKSLEALNADLALGFDTPNATTSPTRRVWYVAPNHRHPLLGQPELRTFLGTSLDRDKIVGTNPRLSVNGLTPRDSWANAPAPRIPDDLHRPEVARGMAAKLAAAHKSIALTLKFPAEQADAMAQVVDQWQTAAKAAGLDLRIRPIPLSAADLAQAIAKRDFELALVHEDHGDSPARLAALFDQRTLAPGGSNFLGVQDATLGGLIATLPLTRQFHLLREQMRNVHVHLEQTMTTIPLWQHQARVSTRFRAPRLDPLRPFADVTTWTK